MSKAKKESGVPDWVIYPEEEWIEITPAQTGFDTDGLPSIGAFSELIIADNSLVYFVDDVFTMRKDRTKQLMHRIIDERLDMPWKCEARADHLTQELCDLMAEAGCVRIKIGFESGSDRDRGPAAGQRDGGHRGDRDHH